MGRFLNGEKGNSEGNQMGQLSVDLSVKVKELHRSLRRAERKGVDFSRYFTSKLEAGKTPYDEIVWELRTATIGNDKGSVIFEQRDIEVPADWSQTATNIVASKYFHGRLGSPERERSVAPTGAPRGGHDCRLGTGRQLLQDAGRRRELPPGAGAPDAALRRRASIRRCGSTWA